MVEDTAQEREEVKIITGSPLIQANELESFIYKSFSWHKRWKAKLTRENISSHIHKKELFYHPFWLAKLLVIAERKPFPPKITPNMAFIDAVSGYRGLFSNIPRIDTQNIEALKLVKPTIKNVEEAQDYVQDVQQKQINRMYILKKPKHQIKEIFLSYLPLWRINLKGSFLPEVCIINANTGESEAYLMSLWERKEWRNITKRENM